MEYKNQCRNLHTCKLFLLIFNIKNEFEQRYPAWMDHRDPRKHSLLRENLSWAQDTSLAALGQGDPRGTRINSLAIGYCRCSGVHNGKHRAFFFFFFLHDTEKSVSNLAGNPPCWMQAAGREKTAMLLPSVGPCMLQNQPRKTYIRCCAS